ncbi:MAG: hypothetical protein RR100_26905, partial [Comamonas sp.]
LAALQGLAGRTGSAEHDSEKARSAAAIVELPVNVQPERPAPASARLPAAVQRVNEVRECPQCTWPLRKLVMRRGPLAGQGVWRCTNTAACSFVQEETSQS